MSESFYMGLGGRDRDRQCVAAPMNGKRPGQDQPILSQGSKISTPFGAQSGRVFDDQGFEFSDIIRAKEA